MPKKTAAEKATKKPKGKVTITVGITVAQNYQSRVFNISLEGDKPIDVLNEAMDFLSGNADGVMEELAVNINEERQKRRVLSDKELGPAGRRSS
jgi:hypothetical protein